MKLETLIKAKRTFNSHSGENLNGAVAYKIFKFVSTIENGAGKFYRKRLTELSGRYGLHSENGLFDLSAMTDERRSQFIAELEELKKLEVDTVELNLTLEDLGAMRLSVDEIETISDFIKEI